MRSPTLHVWPAIWHLFATLSLLGFNPFQSSAQSTDVKWQQVMRGDGFVVDVDADSLTVSSERTIGATFRMVYSRFESVGNAKFKSRIDKYEFANGTYRTIESRFFDSNDREVLSFAAGSPRPVAGTAARFLAAARSLPPFGVWKVLTYTYIDGAGPTPTDSPEVAQLRNSFVTLLSDSVRAGKKACDSPSFDLRIIRNEEVEKRLSVNLKALRINANEIRVLLIGCKGEISPMFLTSPNKAILLWEGVFLSLEREDRRGFDFPPITIK